jgi:hypothetical protein
MPKQLIQITKSTSYASPLVLQNTRPYNGRVGNSPSLLVENSSVFFCMLPVEKKNPSLRLLGIFCEPAVPSINLKKRRGGGQ